MLCPRVPGWLPRPLQQGWGRRIISGLGIYYTSGQSVLPLSQKRDTSDAYECRMVFMFSWLPSSGFLLLVLTAERALFLFPLAFFSPFLQ